jgi:4-hydroxy-tetrahydrodipicolinate reductase
MKQKPIQVIVTGAGGRMGGRIINLLKESPALMLAGAVESPDHPALGRDAGEAAGCGHLNIPVIDRIEKIIGKAQVVIDFSVPSAAIDYLKTASGNKCAMVIGTTGFSKEETKQISASAKKIPCVFSPNMSVGVNRMFKLIADLAKQTGAEYDLEIVESHHRNKKDAPSGTALRLAQILAQALGLDLASAAVYSRHGITGERKPNTIGIQSVRAGDIIGDHTVIFGGLGERLEIKHTAQSRDTFARGAIKAAEWVIHQKPGLYDMMDVLGLRDK